MFGSMKKALVVAAVAGLAAAAPAVASADQWISPGATEISSSGSLEIFVPSTGTTTRCTDVTTNVGDVVLNAGSATPATGSLGSLNLNNCGVVGISACVVNATSDFSAGAWGLQGYAATQRVRINGVTFRNAYSGSGCPLAGVTAVVTGSVEGDYDSAGTLSFNSEPGLTVVNPLLGPAFVTGSVFIDSAPALV